MASKSCEEVSLLRKSDVAARCGVSPRTVDQWIIDESISYVKLGKSVRFSAEDVERFIAEHRIARRAHK
jgi:excisionase family DNA binding protein